MKINNYNNNLSSGSENSDINPKNVFSKFDYDLYDEAKDVVEKIVRIKRADTAGKGEVWRIIENNKVVFIIEGNKISKKEKEYLRTIDGFKFLISQQKLGINSLNSLRIELKKNI
jgi:hypothetical protein